MERFELCLRFPDFKRSAVTLSYDDGRVEDRKMVEILNRYGMKCTFNLNSGLIDGNPDKVQFSEFDKVYQGHEIACHTYTHPMLNRLDTGTIAYEIIKDRELLESVTKKIVTGFAYPFGFSEVPGMVDTIANCGIRYARTTNATLGFGLPTDMLRWDPTCHLNHPKLPELIERFFQPYNPDNVWQLRLFYIWGHPYEFRECWDKLETMCQKLGGQEDVWYVTNGQLVDYLAAYNALKRSANGRIIYNPTDTDIYVTTLIGENVVLKKQQTTVFE